jgi:hypothetical protein
MFVFQIKDKRLVNNRDNSLQLFFGVTFLRDIAVSVRLARLGFLNARIEILLVLDQR